MNASLRLDGGRPLRVLHVLGELHSSGAETMLRAAAAEFAKQGVVCDILATGTQSPGPFSEALEQAEYRVHHVALRTTLSGLPRALFRVFRVMQQGDYNAIHLHTERMHFWLGLVGLLCGAPRILRTVHSIFGFEGWLRRKRCAQRRILGALGVQYVSIGRSVRDNELDRFTNHTLLIPNWYDSDHFRPPTDGERQRARNALAIPAENVVVLTVGNCSDVKNHGMVIEALSLVPKDLPVLYVHVGQEEPGQPERSLARRLGLEGRVRFLGRTEDPLQALYAADVYVMPSKYEGFGIAALEALAVGLPTVLGDVSGLRDLRESFDDILWAIPTAEGFREMLIKASAILPGKRDELRHRYAEVIKTKFGIERGVRAYCRLYRGEKDTGHAV